MPTLTRAVLCALALFALTSAPRAPAASRPLTANAQIAHTAQTDTVQATTAQAARTAQAETVQATTAQAAHTAQADTTRAATAQAAQADTVQATTAQAARTAQADTTRAATAQAETTRAATAQVAQVETVQATTARAAQAAAAQGAGGAGRVLGTARGQVAWLDLVAPRPVAITQLNRPAYPADIAAAAGLPYAVASVVQAFSREGANAAPGGDLVLIDLASNTSRTLLARQSDTESLDLPAIWPDGSGILYQRSNLRAPIPMPGQAQPQYQSRIEQVDAEGQRSVTVLDDARYPGPAPDGSRFAFVRSTDQGAGIWIHSLADGSDTELVPPGQFLALAYPRFSPDGQQVAFVAIPLAAPIGRRSDNALVSWLQPQPALAHGFPWEAWIASADGSSRRQIQDVLDDDPSLTWSPDGTQLLIYGGWGSFLVDAASGSASPLAYLAGYGAIAWLPD